MIITAHFATLRRAVNEARKYGVQQTFETIEQSILRLGQFQHFITADRDLVLSRAQGRKRWKMAVDVQGSVKPVNTAPPALVEVMEAWSM